jgi:hypothetical protein
MPLHFNSTLDIRLQIRDRMRDLLEADSLVQSVYSGTIKSLIPETVSVTDDLVVALELADADLMAAGQQTAGGTNLNSPWLLLGILKYTSQEYTTDPEAEYDVIANATGFISQAILRYQFDPTPSLPGVSMLWDTLKFSSPATTPKLLPGKFWFTLTKIQLSSYQNNP